MITTPERPLHINHRIEPLYALSELNMHGIFRGVPQDEYNSGGLKDVTCSIKTPWPIPESGTCLYLHRPLMISPNYSTKKPT